MGLVYDENRRQFFKQEDSTVSGLKSDFIQAFYTNVFVNSNSTGSLAFHIDTPKYNMGLGTMRYYQQSPDSILTTFSKPCINFTFSGDVENLSALTLVHDIYRIDWVSYYNFLQCYNRPQDDMERQTDAEIIRERITENGVTTERIIQKDRAYSQSKDNFNRKNCVSKQEIINKIIYPIYSITASTSSITYNTYAIRLPETIKPVGQVEQLLFNDRDQFFIDTRYVFNIPDINNNKELTYYEDGEFKTKKISAETPYITISTGSTITGGTFANVPVKGDYFTYFKIPNQPLLTGDIASGQLTTFSPKIQFTNVEDGDYYIAQVNYNTGDTGFTGTVYTTTYSKYETILAEGNPTDRASGDLDNYGYYIETTSDTIHEIGLALKTKNSAIYRIGNVKEVFNIFGVKQKVVTFSDTYSVITPVYDLSDKVYVQSDSPNVLTQATLDPDTKLDDPCFLDTGWVLSGTVVGSIVTGATLVLHCPSGTDITKPTDSTGYFEFDDLDSGTYTLYTYYRGYQTDVRTLNITADSYITYKIKLLWSNKWDTWGKLANENYYIGP